MNLWSSSSSPPYLLRRPLLLVTLLYCLGLLIADQFGFLGFPPPANRSIPEGRCVITGIVTDAPDLYPNRVTFPVEVERIQMGKIKSREIKIRVTVKGLTPIPLVGDRLTLRGFLRVPGPPSNPGEFDYRRYLWRQNLAATFSVKVRPGLTASRQANFLNLGDSHKYPVHRWAHRVSLGVKRSLERCLKPEDAAVFAGLTVGVKPHRYPEIEAAFRASGTIHVLVASGSNVAFVIGLWVFLARWILKIPTRIAMAGSIPWAIAYSFIAGADPPVTRACIMSSVAIIGYLLAREDRAYHSLGLSALCLLLWDPKTLFDLSFQMSFATVFGLIHFAPVIYSLGNWRRARSGARDIPGLRPDSSRLRDIPSPQTMNQQRGSARGPAGVPNSRTIGPQRRDAGWPPRLRFLLSKFLIALAQVVATSWTAELWLFPIFAVYFHRVPLSACLPNLVVVPLSAIGLQAGLGLAGLDMLAEATRLTVFHWARDILALGCSGIAEVMLYTARKSAAFSGGGTWFPTPSLGWVVVFYLVLLSAVWVRRSLFCRWVTLMGMLALVFWPGRARSIEPGVTWLDVGEGDAIVIHCGKGQTLLVAGGVVTRHSAFDVGERIILPYLADRGVKRLNAVFLTGPGPTQLDGLQSVVNTVPVERIFAPIDVGWSGRFGVARVNCLGSDPLFLQVDFGESRVLLRGPVATISPRRLGVVRPSYIVVSSKQRLPSFYRRIPVLCTKANGAIFFRPEQRPPTSSTIQDY